MLLLVLRISKLIEKVKLITVLFFFRNYCYNFNFDFIIVCMVLSLEINEKSTTSIESFAVCEY